MTEEGNVKLSHPMRENDSAELIHGDLTVGRGFEVNATAQGISENYRGMGSRECELYASRACQY